MYSALYAFVLIYLAPPFAQFYSWLLIGARGCALENLDALTRGLRCDELLVGAVFTATIYDLFTACSCV